MSKLLSLCWIFIAIIASAGVSHAAKVDPPTIALGRPSTSIVAADYFEAGPNRRLVFKRAEVIRSAVDVPELIDIAQPDLREPLVAGKRYLLAYTSIAPDKRRRMSTMARGAVFLSSPGLEPSLWDDTATNRELVAWKIDDDLDAARAALPKLLNLLKKGDTQQRNFAAGEIAYRPELLRSLSDAEQKALARFVAGRAGPDRARGILMAMAPSMKPSAAAQRNWNKVARSILANNPVATRNRDGASQVVIASLAHVGATRAALEPKILSRWLLSDDLNIVEMADAELYRMSPTIARQALESALTDANLSDDGRQVLQRQLSRVNPTTVRIDNN